jgi:hypothetical protein
MLVYQKEEFVEDQHNGYHADGGYAQRALPVGFVPTPTIEYRAHRKRMKTTVEPGAPAELPIPGPILLPSGRRVLIWKQDPSVGEIGVRKVYLSGKAQAGPRDLRIANGSPGLPAVSPNSFGDFIQVPGSDAFDAVHAYAVVRMTLTMYQRALATGGNPGTVPWQWNSSTNVDPLSIFPHGLPDTINAFYSRNERVLKFGDFIPPGSPPGSPRVFTCRSLDIVSHEAGHAILDGLRPSWLAWGNPPQTGGLHESFGDLTAIFLALSQLDQVEAIIAQTKANLHDKTFLADMAEQFGLALGRPNGLRNADNDLKLSQVGTEVHAVSQVFTGAIYDILADIFAAERKPQLKDDAATLYEVGQYVFSLVVRAIRSAPASAATFADVANQMLTIAHADGKPTAYRNFIRNRFTVREVIVSPSPLTADVSGTAKFAPGVQDDANAVQNRGGCCGTMTLEEYEVEDADVVAEIKALKASFVEPRRQLAKVRA